VSRIESDLVLQPIESCRLIFTRICCWSECLPEAARRALQMMNASKYEYQSEFARRYFGQGKAAGKVEGRVEIVLELLATRYGMLSAAVETHVRGAGSAELDAIAKRMLTASTLDEALGVPGRTMRASR
jgi:hypothetical protein